jgi:hypothetical protein
MLILDKIHFRKKSARALRNINVHTKTCTQLFTETFVSDSQKLETTKISYNTWTVKQTLEHPLHGLLLSNRKEWTLYIKQPGWISRRWCWVKKANLKRVLYNSLRTMSMSWQNKHGQEINGYQRLNWGWGFVKRQLT